MAAYSYGQLEQLWIDAGGPKSLAPLMAAIALAESSGNPDALNLTDNGGTQTSVGLWQVSTGTHDYPAQWRTPAGNAREAVSKYRTQGLSAWGTYDSGAYKRYYQGSVPPSQLPPGGGSGSVGVPGLPGVSVPIGGAASLGQGLAGIGDSLSSLVKGVEWLFVPSHWVRIFAGVGGFVLVGAGGFGLFKAAAGKAGDVTLAVAILTTAFGGTLLFIAFHNLPEDVTSLPGMLDHLAKGIQTGSYT